MIFTAEQIDRVLTNFEEMPAEVTELVACLSKSTFFMTLVLHVALTEGVDPVKAASNLSVGIALGYRLAVETALAEVDRK
jgi:hypothetical protein